MIKWVGPSAKAVKTVSFQCSIKASSSHPSWVESCSRCLCDEQWSAHAWPSVYSRVPLFYASWNDQMIRHTSQTKKSRSGPVVSTPDVATYQIRFNAKS